MRSENFNMGWRVKSGVEQPFDAIFAPQTDQGEEVILPHDAMLSEPRRADCQSGGQLGFYPAKTYTYTKEFFVPADWEEQIQIVEFEGIMSKAMVYLNGNYIAAHKYGYSSLFVELSPHLLYGKTNKLKVVSLNNDLASRWYSGSGIYRNVVLWRGGRTHVRPEQVRITTERIRKDYATLRIDYQLTNTEERTCKLTVEIEIEDQNGRTAAKDYQIVYAQRRGASELSLRIGVPEAMPWRVETPNLYTLHMRIKKDGQLVDRCEESFGIRTLELDARSGLCINGEEVKLRGACIHHDNGIIGATTLDQAEEFRIRKLKEAGFNSIRCAHNPASKAMLRACDRLGVLVMDELCDMWNEAKNENDFSIDFADTWKKEAERMVSKDYNHPSVVLYSTGNEVPEIGRSSGAVMNQKIVAEIKKKDATRFITCGISGYLAVADHMGEYAADMEQVSSGNGGSEELNSMMGATEQQKLDAFSVSPLLSECLEPVEGQLDVIGYNYLTARHEYEHTLHPDRVIVGSETYPPEIPSLWKIVMRNPYVIGDFSWTGYDYMGEAGIGIFHYDTDRKEQSWYPDRLAGLGDLDINGNRRTISYLREIAYGLRKAPYIAVERVDKQGHKAGTNNWKYTDSIHSWTFPGYEGTVTKVHVLSGYPDVELFLDGKSLGRRKIEEEDQFTAVYEVGYEAGTLRAVAYEDGQVVAEDILATADAPAKLKIGLSKDCLSCGGGDVCFATIDLLDGADRWSRFEARRVSVKVEGDGSLLGFGSADPSSEGSYRDTEAATYDGRIMAAVRSGLRPGRVRLTVEAEGCPAREVAIEVK